MVTRGDRFTVKTTQIEVYSDFYIDFDLNPITGYLARLTNEDSVKQSLKTLLLTQRGERFYDVACGSRLYALLFEPIDTVTESSIKDEIITTIQNNEPRVSDVAVTAAANADNNAYNVTIYYSIINIPTQTFTLNLMLSRTR